MLELKSGRVSGDTIVSGELWCTVCVVSALIPGLE